MGPLDFLRSQHAELSALRRDLHAHPELGFEEHRTVEVVTRELDKLGLEYHTGVGKTGVVAVLRGERQDSGRAIGLRADMDALPLHEENDFAHVSRFKGRMHACGHDGHTAMLLGVARYLAGTRRFDGTVHLIFQPGEEGFGGGKAMVDDGLFERFPADAVYALHNWPGLAIDPVLVAGHIITATQSIVARNVSPVDTAVVSLCAMHAGNLAAMSVIPREARLVGTVRTFRPQTADAIERRLHDLVHSIAAAFGASATLKYERLYPATINTEREAVFAADVAASLIGEHNVVRDLEPSMGSEDFSFMLQRRPGAYARLGQGGAEGGCFLHNSRYDFNDEIIPLGAGYMAALAEQALPLLG
jgi:metal-dependent amidase/aminoacylase/carboxypeptidase family protein